MEKNIIEVKKMDTIFGENMYELIVGIQNSNGTRMTTTICELSFENLREIQNKITDVLLHDYMEQAPGVVKIKQQEYHNYPIGTIIYPHDNSYCKLVETTDEWDGIDHTDYYDNGQVALYGLPCEVVSEEYIENIGCDLGCEFVNEDKPFVNIKYKCAIYRILICEYIDMTMTCHNLKDDFDVWNFID